MAWIMHINNTPLSHVNTRSVTLSSPVRSNVTVCHAIEYLLISMPVLYTHFSTYKWASMLWTLLMLAGKLWNVRISAWKQVPHY